MKTIAAKKKRLTVIQNQKVQTLVSIHMTQELNLNGKVVFSHVKGIMIHRALTFIPEIFLQYFSI